VVCVTALPSYPRLGLLSFFLHHIPDFFLIMAARRDAADRDRERASRAPAQPRTNEYFVPKDGIDREVITADICRYLGNDALVRPGNYENPQTRQIQHGYFITAYRNLTTAMIADLKADSDRWDAERRQTASRGLPSNVEYRSSNTHQTRQYYGPTEPATGASAGYPPPATAGPQTGLYDNGYPLAYNSHQYGVPQPQGGYDNSNYAYVAGAEMAVESRSTARPPVQQPGQMPGAVPRYTSSTPTYQDTRQYNYPPASAPHGASVYPPETFYGRGAYGDSTPSELYDQNQYREAPVYQSQPSTTASTPATSGPPRRERSEREDRERRTHGDRRHR